MLSFRRTTRTLLVTTIVSTYATMMHQSWSLRRNSGRGVCRRAGATSRSCLMFREHPCDSRLGGLAVCRNLRTTGDAGSFLNRRRELPGGLADVLEQGVAPVGGGALVCGQAAAGHDPAGPQVRRQPLDRRARLSGRPHTRRQPAHRQDGSRVPAQPRGTRRAHLAPAEPRPPPTGTQRPRPPRPTPPPPQADRRTSRPPPPPPAPGPSSPSTRDTSANRTDRTPGISVTHPHQPPRRRSAPASPATANPATHRPRTASQASHNRSNSAAQAAPPATSCAKPAATCGKPAARYEEPADSRRDRGAPATPPWAAQAH